MTLKTQENLIDIFRVFFVFLVEGHRVYLMLRCVLKMMQPKINLYLDYLFYALSLNYELYKKVF